MHSKGFFRKGLLTNWSYPGIDLERLRNNTNTLSQVSLFLGLGSYLVPSNSILVTESYSGAKLPFIFFKRFLK